MKKILILIAVAISVAAATAFVAHAGGEICNGTVKTDLGDPLPMATIELWKLEQSDSTCLATGGSGQTGAFSFWGTYSEGSYWVLVSKEGWATRKKTFSYNGSTTVNLGNIVLFQ